ncbi:unnamed protein product [Bursaphelenchus xylophilus]|uniref:(pine wood nematode) hypothetical protein n=1 Tax=Bursaphelenchus xylophilus TaxID=6326 RepID=A0A1I7SFY4_BURXY|nr:unnamed protein product [Bursaphelenchus xylophilus]CAG9132163.1 unnamed protein product [Bursaphelenchus xylophilus]
MLSAFGISFSLLGLMLTIVGLCGKKKTAARSVPSPAKPVRNQTEISKPPGAAPTPAPNPPKCEVQGSKIVDNKAAKPEKKEEGGSADKPPAKENDKKANESADGKQEAKSKKENSKKKSVGTTQSPRDDPDPEPDGPNSQKTQISRTVKVCHDDDTIKHVESLKEDKNKSE